MTSLNMRQPIIEEYSYTSPDGNNYRLTRPRDRVVWQLQGRGMSPHNLATTKGPYQQGSSPVSVNLQPRQITMQLRNNGCDRDEFWTIRDYWIDVFRENRTEINNPSPGTLTLKRYDWSNGTKVERAIDIFYEEGFGFTPPASGIWDEFSIQEAISFIALNPLWYDPNQETVSVTSFTESLILPMTFPFVLGGWYATQDITYTGTWEEYPIIEATGPFSGLTIQNETTGLELNLGYEALANEVVTFNLLYNYKTVTSDCSGNLAAYIRESDISSFALQCDPLVTDGTNTINIYLGGYQSGTTQVEFKYYNRYRGI